VTDANVLLQTLNPTHLLGGRMKVRQDLARAAIGRLAEQLGMEPMATAQGIISVVTANMARAIRVISVQRGHDPRDYTLMAFGGAGPLHAARLARELDIKRILVPRNPGILCAMGLLLTDLRADFASTRLHTLSPAVLSDVQEAFTALQKRAEAWFVEEQISPLARQITRKVDMRYAGQNYELAVGLPEGPITLASLQALEAGFLQAHRQMYGFVAEEDPVQLVTFRVAAAGLVNKAQFSPQPPTRPNASAAQMGWREIWMPEAGGFVSCPVYDRDKLACGHQFDGPAVVEQMDATTVILSGMSAVVDPYLNLIVQVGA
jgi:N-methylhydantoinase A